MDEKLEEWCRHAEKHRRSAIVGISLGPVGAEIYNHFDQLSDDDFDDVCACLFALFSGRPGAPLEKRLEMMMAAARHAAGVIMLEEMPPAGEA